MAILISQTKLRELLDEAYTEGRDDATIVVSYYERDNYRKAAVDALMEKALQEEPSCTATES
jgi:hypothetical protein